MDINEKMDEAVINDDFNSIENIALNPKNAYVNVGKFNIFNGKFWREWEWVDISSVINKEDYFEDLNGDCQDYVMQLDKYKNMDNDSKLAILSKKEMKATLGHSPDFADALMMRMRYLFKSNNRIVAWR